MIHVHRYRVQSLNDLLIKQKRAVSARDAHVYRHACESSPA
jgi:hypothetical protein